MQRILLWGSLRLLIGIVQNALALASVLAAISVGFALITWVLIGGTVVATAISVALYKRRPRATARSSKI